MVVLNSKKNDKGWKKRNRREALKWLKEFAIISCVFERQWWFLHSFPPHTQVIYSCPYSNTLSFTPSLSKHGISCPLYLHTCLFAPPLLPHKPRCPYSYIHAFITLSFSKHKLYLPTLIRTPVSSILFAAPPQ